MEREDGNEKGGDGGSVGSEFGGGEKWLVGWVGG